jgi:hypothetical protein
MQGANAPLPMNRSNAYLHAYLHAYLNAYLLAAPARGCWLFAWNLLGYTENAK